MLRPLALCAALLLASFTMAQAAISPATNPNPQVNCRKVRTLLQTTEQNARLFLNDNLSVAYARPLPLGALRLLPYLTRMGSHPTAVDYASRLTHLIDVLATSCLLPSFPGGREALFFTVCRTLSPPRLPNI